MTNRFNRAVLMLTIVFSTSIITSCKDDEIGNHYDDLYVGTTDNVVDYYFKPKKAFAYSWHKRITGNWFYNDKAGIEGLELNEIYDSKQEYADQYYFLDDKGLSKYLEQHDNTNYGEIMIESNDIISPYKEYAQYYEDYGHATNHDQTDFVSGIQACVMPVTAIDIVCNKDFDAEHPAGSKLNDIIKYDQDYDTYTFLQSPENKGKNTYYRYHYIPDFEPRQLTEIPRNPIYMMNRAYELFFDHEPTSPGTYEFTVKFTFGADPLTGETVDIAPAKVSIDF